MSTEGNRPAHDDQSLQLRIILGVLAMNVIAIASVIAINSGAAWLDLTYRAVTFIIGALFVWPVCVEAVSQMRSDHRDFVGRSSFLASLWRRLLIYTLTLLPPFFSLVLLCDFVRSWFMPALIGGNPVLLFLLLLGPYIIRKRTRRAIQRLVYT